MKDNIVKPMMVHGYKIPADTVAQAINWMTDGCGFEAASLRDFLKARGLSFFIYAAADRLIAKAKRDGLIEFDSFHRVWRKVQK